MSVGGVVIDVVKVRDDKWWIDTIDRADLMHGGRTCAVFCDPKGEPIEVGDSLWWQGGWCFWTPRDRSRADVKLPKIGYSGVSHPDRVGASPKGEMAIDDILADIREEVCRAERKHAPMNSAHEGYAVIAEEVDELWDEVKKQTSARRSGDMHTECVQIAAMAIRFVLNVLWKTRAESTEPRSLIAAGRPGEE